MWMARMSPRSSVTGQRLLTNVRKLVVASCDRCCHVSGGSGIGPPRIPAPNRLAVTAAIDVRDRRDRAPDQAPLPARRAVDELLELGPTISLVQDALADRMGEAVDRDPVTRVPSGAADQLPGALRIVEDQSLE